MDTLTNAAAAGIRARTESLELLANNLANSSTAGYKADRESYSLYLAEDQDAAGLPAPMPLVEKPWVDLRQGVLTSTGRPTDLALEGPGFFSVQGPKGPLYTRGGSFQIDRAGRLVTREGFELITVEPARIRARADLPIEVDAAGRVSQQGQYLGQLRLSSAPEGHQIEKSAGGYFAWQRGADAPVTAVVRQGFLESSNTSPAESSVRLIHVLRQFESLQRALQLGNEMNKRAVEDVARAGT